MLPIAQHPVVKADQFRAKLMRFLNGTDDSHCIRFTFKEFVHAGNDGCRAAERCPPPVSEEMIRIFGTLASLMLVSCYSGAYGQPVHLLLSLVHVTAGLFHFAFKLLDFDQMCWIERQ